MDIIMSWYTIKIEPSYSVNRPAKVCSHEEDPGKHQRIVKTDKEEELLKVDGEEDAEDKHPIYGGAGG